MMLAHFLPRRRRPHAGALLRWCAIGALTALVVAAAWTPSGALAADAAATEPSVSRPSAPNRLKVGTLVEFDPRAGSVGDAMRSLLDPVHYRLTVRTVDPIVSASVLRRPIPAIATNAGVMSIEAALLLLIGDENRLVVDHTNRLVAIERMPADTTAPTSP
jgi:hypothetical protein